MLRKLLKYLGWGSKYITPLARPQIVLRKDHLLSRRLISEQALKVLYRLQRSGFSAYLVGGGIRDVLLGLHPKDFDVVTNAKPEEIYQLFRNSRMIGRRFRLVHVHFSGHIVEVATFRSGKNLELNESFGDEMRQAAIGGMILRDNVYGTLEEDVWRRDFTINALYYNIENFSILDFVGGMSDLKAGIIRMIGKPSDRYREDPLRMLRAIRIAAKLNFTLEKETEKPIFVLGNLITEVPAARLLDEVGKLFLSGHAENSFILLRKYGVFAKLFPDVENILNSDRKNTWLNLMVAALQNTDSRIQHHKPVALAFLLAVFLWGPLFTRMQKKQAQGLSKYLAFQEAAAEVFKYQHPTLALPRRLTHFMKELWIFQLRMTQLSKLRVFQLISQKAFSGAFDFLQLRAAISESEEAVVYAEWWKKFLQGNETDRAELIKGLRKTSRKKKKRKR